MHLSYVLQLALVHIHDAMLLMLWAILYPQSQDKSRPIINNMTCLLFAQSFRLAFLLLDIPQQPALLPAPIRPRTRSPRSMRRASSIPRTHPTHSALPPRASWTTSRAPSSATSG